MVGIYLGLIVHKPITHQRKYDLVLAEMMNYLSIHSTEAAAKCHSNRKVAGKLLVVEAHYGSEPVSLPLSAGMLHTCHFRVSNVSNPPDDVKQFASIVWECLQILRENYPSRIDLTDDGLDKCVPYFSDLSQAELLRREVSCISSRRDDPALLTTEELSEVWFVLYTSLKMHEARATLMSLQLLADGKHCPPNVFKEVRQSDVNMLESLCEETELSHFATNPAIAEECKSLARDVLDLCVRGKGTKDLGTLSEAEMSSRSTILPGAYDMPSSLRAMLFQLNETVCVERATFLLECINSKPDSELLQTSLWLETLQSVLHKYCDGVYGSEDHDVVHFGLFQYALVQCFGKLCVHPETFLSLLNMGLFMRLFEVVEEACLFAYRMVMDKAEFTDSRLFDFIQMTLSLGELSISAVFYKFLRPILEALYKVDSRLLGFIETDQNDGEKDIPAPADPEELRVLSQDLYVIRERIRSMITKLEAITEYQESYEEKYERLFNKKGAAPETLR